MKETFHTVLKHSAEICNTIFTTFLCEHFSFNFVTGGGGCNASKHFKMEKGIYLFFSK